MERQGKAFRWQERNLKKAEESADKVHRAAEQRIRMTATQREQYLLRTAAQQERLAAQKKQQERRITELRAAAQMKTQVGNVCSDLSAPPTVAIVLHSTTLHFSPAPGD